MKNCIKNCFYFGNPLNGRVIPVPCKKLLFQLPVSAVHDFFQRTCLDLLYAIFHVGVCWFQKHTYVKALADFSDMNAIFFDVLPYFNSCLSKCLHKVVIVFLLYQATNTMGQYNYGQFFLTIYHNFYLACPEFTNFFFPLAKNNVFSWYHKKESK